MRMHAQRNSAAGDRVMPAMPFRFQRGGALAAYLRNGQLGY